MIPKCGEATPLLPPSGHDKPAPGTSTPALAASSATWPVSLRVSLRAFTASFVTVICHLDSLCLGPSSWLCLPVPWASVFLWGDKGAPSSTSSRQCPVPSYSAGGDWGVMDVVSTAHCNCTPTLGSFQKCMFSGYTDAVRRPLLGETLAAQEWPWLGQPVLLCPARCLQGPAGLLNSLYIEPVTDQGL